MPSWFNTNDDSKKPDNKKEPMSHRFLSACLFILGGVIALWIALELLARFWGWLLLIVGIVFALWAVFKLIQMRRNRW